MLTLKRADRRRMRRLVDRAILEAARPDKTEAERLLRNRLFSAAEDLAEALEASKSRKNGK